MISPLQNMRLKLAHHVSMREIKDRVTTLVLGASSLALALAPIFFLFWLMQPKVLANPGIGALRVAGAASYEPFLHDAEPPQSAEPPRRELAARLTQHDPQYREAAISAQRGKPAVSPRTVAQDHQTRPRLRAIFGRASALEWPRAGQIVRVSGISACGAPPSNATGLSCGAIAQSMRYEMFETVRSEAIMVSASDNEQSHT